jgi:hypothetical protein
VLAVSVQWGVLFCSLVAKYCYNWEELLPASCMCDSEGPFTLLQSICEVMLHRFLKYHNVYVCSYFSQTVTNVNLCHSVV